MFKKSVKFFGTGFLWLTLGFLSLWAGAAGLNIVHTAFPTADSSTEFGIPYSLENLNTVLQTNMLSKTVVINNASSAYQVPSNTAYLIFAGTNTNAATFAISMVPAASALDNQEVSIYSQAAVSAVSVTSVGASAVGGPSVVTANWHVKYKYDAGTLSWYAVDN